MHAFLLVEQDALLDDVMLGFRLKEGLDLEVVASNYGQTAVRRVEEGVAEGLRRGWVIRDENGRKRSGGSAKVGQGVDVSGTRSGTNCASQASSVGGNDGAVDGHDIGSSGRAGVEAAGGGGEEATQGILSGGTPSGGLGRLRLSDPDGFLFSNSVISSVFCELDGWKNSRQAEKEGAATGR